jgi:hypothetical protein
MAKFSRPFSVSRKVAGLREKVRVDTQKIRERLLENLQAIFNEAARLAKGETTVNGEELTLKQRQAWARVAAYTAQVIQGVAKGFDEHEIDVQLDELQRLVDEARTKTKAK